MLEWTICMCNCWGRQSYFRVSLPFSHPMQSYLVVDVELVDVAPVYHKPHQLCLHCNMHAL